MYKLIMQAIRLFLHILCIYFTAKHNYMFLFPRISVQKIKKSCIICKIFLNIHFKISFLMSSHRITKLFLSNSAITSAVLPYENNVLNQPFLLQLANDMKTSQFRFQASCHPYFPKV